LVIALQSLVGVVHLCHYGNPMIAKIGHMIAHAFDATTLSSDNAHHIISMIEQERSCVASLTFIQE
jgi:hypothetical protein